MLAVEFSVYLLRCGDGSLYAGITTDLQRRLREHNAGQGAAYTRSRLPVTLVYDEQTPNSIPQLVQGFELKTPEIQQIVLEHVLKVLQGGADPNKTMDDAQKQALARVARK